MTNGAKVVVKKEAFRNMITHVLKYGSEALETSYEVLGVCMGKLENPFQVVNAIPLTHGSGVDIETNQKILQNFAKTEEQYLKRSLPVMGWYCSHPNNGLDYTDKDIKNHMFFKKKYDPDVVGIIFDHDIMGKDGNLGVKAYQINQEGVKEIKLEVEIPKTLDYFNWAKKFVEDSQKQSPILIKEIGELTSTSPNNLQEIPLSKEDFVDEGAKKENNQIEPIISGFKSGVSSFTELFMGTFLNQLSTWTKEVNQGALNGSKTLHDTIIQMKDAISISMSKIDRFFKKSLEVSIQQFKQNTTSYVDERIKTQKELAEIVASSKEEFSNSLNTLIKDNINSVIGDIDEGVKVVSDKTNETSQVSAQLEETVNNLSKKFNELINETVMISNEIHKNIASSITPTETNISSQIEKISSEINPIKENCAGLGNKLQKIRDIIKEISDV